MTEYWVLGTYLRPPTPDLPPEARTQGAGAEPEIDRAKPNYNIQRAPNKNAGGISLAVLVRDVAERLAQRPS